LCSNQQKCVRNFTTMPALEFTVGAFVAAIPSCGIRAVFAVIEARRILKIKQEKLDCLNRKVYDKLLHMAALMYVEESYDKELVMLLEKAAQHIGITSAGQSYCEQNGVVCWQTLVHNAEVYFGISSDSLQILIEDVNAYTSENRDFLKCAQSRSDHRFQSILDEQQTLFEGEVAAHHMQHFGRLEARFDDVWSGCWQRFNFCCTGTTFENEIESI